ncbi:MAG: tRNA lysidine(34) synthetase TilS [Clostridium sp.]
MLVALSGGPDSVCLLYMLNSIKDEFNLTIGAAHINHMLRGDESTLDEEYVQKICKELNIPCYIKRINIDSVAKSLRVSHEMAGRDERYKYFDDISNKHGYHKIAVAHNANDQAETILMRMMRGTGIEGLCGIRAKRGFRIIRPILSLSRAEIEAYCIEKNLKPRIDKSNLENVYSRNKVRLDILPYMKEHFNEDIIETLNRMAGIIQKDDEYINKQSSIAFSENCEITSDNLLISKNIFSLDDAIVTRVIKKSLIDSSGEYRNFEMKHIYDVIDLATKGTNKKIDLPNDMIAENIYGNINLKSKKNKCEQKECIDEIIISKKDICNIKYDFIGYKVTIEVINNKNNIEFYNNVLIKYFDYDNIIEGIIIRTRKDGDKIKPLGMNGNKKVKDILINAKVPVEERGFIPIVCFDSYIGWIVGHKASNDYKLTQKTKKIIKISFVRKE